MQRLFEVDENLFEKLEQLLESKNGSKTISLEHYNVEVDQANLRIENGEFYSSEDVEKMTCKS